MIAGQKEAPAPYESPLRLFAKDTSTNLGLDSSITERLLQGYYGEFFEHLRSLPPEVQTAIFDEKLEGKGLPITIRRAVAKQLTRINNMNWFSPKEEPDYKQHWILYKAGEAQVALGLEPKPARVITDWSEAREQAIYADSSQYYYFGANSRNTYVPWNQTLKEHRGYDRQVTNQGAIDRQLIKKRSEAHMLALQISSEMALRGAWRVIENRFGDESFKGSCIPSLPTIHATLHIGSITLSDADSIENPYAPLFDLYDAGVTPIGQDNYNFNLFIPKMQIRTEAA